MSRHNYIVEDVCYEDRLSEQSGFVIQPYRRAVLKHYISRYGRDNLHKLWDNDVSEVLKQQGFIPESDPRSVYKVNKLYQALGKYDPKLSPKVDMSDPDVKAGVNLAYSLFARPESELRIPLEQITPDFVLHITSNLKGSAGLTAYGMSKAKAYVRAYERSIQQAKGEKKPEPCIAFKRTQFNDKTRLVWGYPYAMTVLEGIFARPIIDRFERFKTPMAFQMSTGALGTRMRVSSYHKKWAYSTDVSSYDSSISAQLINVAFNILATWFNLDDVEATSGVEYSVIYSMVRSYFIHTPIVMPNGMIYYGKKHGVPSGSYFTQLVDSIVNVIMVGAISNHFNMFIDKRDIYVLGDDILFWSNRLVELESIADFGSKLFNVKMNEKKSSRFNYKEVIHFLGRDWENGVPSLNQEDILKRMSQPESFRKYSDDEKRRQAQVRYLILSYAAVYKQAYNIYSKVIGDVNYYSSTADARQAFFVHYHRFQDVRYDPDSVSGLLRFMMKYGNKSRDGMVPLAIQFWK